MKCVAIRKHGQVVCLWLSEVLQDCVTQCQGERDTEAHKKEEVWAGEMA